jgi:hypothetical protein
VQVLLVLDTVGVTPAPPVMPRVTGGGWSVEGAAVRRLDIFNRTRLTPDEIVHRKARYFDVSYFGDTALVAGHKGWRLPSSDAPNAVTRCVRCACGRGVTGRITHAARLSVVASAARLETARCVSPSV